MKIFEYFNIEVLSGENTLLGGPDGVRLPRNRYSAEQVLFSYIRDGDSDGLIRLINSQPAFHVGRLSDDELRQAQYLGVAFITLAIRAAIEGGMLEADAYRASDLFVRHIDRERRPETILRLCFETSIELARCVGESKPAPHHSPPIRKCMEYIGANLNGRITLEELAALCNLTPVYLSTLFKKETGINLSQYILDKKLAAAKALIREGGHSFEEISNRLGFCSQSYFIRCFKREFGLTPREYLLLTDHA